MLLLLACVVFGIGFGLLLHKLFGKTGNEHTLAKENQQLKSEFDHYRGQVNNHFSTSAELFEKVSDDYRRLLGHMADGTSNLNVELSDRLLADFEVAPTPLKAPDEETEQPAQSVEQETDNAEDVVDIETMNTSETEQTGEPPANDEPTDSSVRTEPDDNKQ